MICIHFCCYDFPTSSLLRSFKQVRFANGNNINNNSNIMMIMICIYKHNYRPISKTVQWTFVHRRMVVQLTQLGLHFMHHYYSLNITKYRQVSYFLHGRRLGHLERELNPHRIIDNCQRFLQHKYRVTRIH